jgi:hypothetical protein
MSRPYNNFVKFYDENKNKLLMPKGINYPLNYKKAKLWADSHCDKESRVFADDIVRNTRYVSFKMFLNKLTEVCKSYKETYSDKKHQGTIFVLILPWNIKKSNTWVSMLAFEYLRDLVSEVYYEIFDVFNDMKDKRSRLYGKKVRCIVCDDCAYTGQQLTHMCSMDYHMIKFENRPVEPSPHSKEWFEWYDIVKSKAKLIVDTVSINSFSVDLLVPYISTLASIRLKKIHYVKVPKNYVKIPIFSQIINATKIPPHIMNEFKRTFQYHKDLTAIYFDHKIADAISTFNKVYSWAPLFNCSSQKQVGVKFIDNCPTVNIPPQINTHTYYLDIEKGIQAVCPPSFYKKIKYTFNNKGVGQTSLFKLLGKNEKIKG